MSKTGELIACEGKLRYPTRAEVDVAVRAMNQPRRDRRGHAQGYRCPYCHFYHVGRPMKWRPEEKPKPAHRPRIEREPDPIDEFLNGRHFAM